MCLTHISTGHKYKSTHTRTHTHIHLLVKSVQSHRGEDKSEAQKVGMKEKPLITQMHTNVLPHTSRPAKILGIKNLRGI